MNRFQKLISYVFHPIIFPFVGSVLYFILSPKYTSKNQEYAILLTVFISTYVLPLLFMVLLKKLKMINTYHLKTTVERKFPFIFLMTLSFLLGNMLYKTSFAKDLAHYFFGSAFAMALAYFYLFFQKKISLHTLGIGSLIGFMVLLSIVYKQNILIAISILILLSGLIAMSRLYLKAHTAKEVLVGFIVGVSTQFVAYFTVYKIANQLVFLSYL